MKMSFAIRENLRMGNFMAMGFILMVIRANMRVNGKKVRKVDMES